MSPARLPIPPQWQLNRRIVPLPHLLYASKAFTILKFVETAQIADLLKSFFSVNSVGSIAARAFLWFVVAIVIIAATDTGGDRHGRSNLKSNLGMLLFFVFLAGGLMYLMFGFIPTI